ncbi:hypothetical protein BCR36DRAFT_257804, partial [Piromyces finnis]
LSSPFNLMITELSNMVNKTQYFNPFFSWIIVVYTYFSIAYTLVIRIVIAHTEITGRVDVYINNKKTGKNDKFDDSILNYFNGALYFPLGILCTVFIFLIFQKFITEDNNESRNVLSVLLHSTLSRMIFGKFF